MVNFTTQSAHNVCRVLPDIPGASQFMVAPAATDIPWCLDRPGGGGHFLGQGHVAVCGPGPRGAPLGRAPPRQARSVQGLRAIGPPGLGRVCSAAGVARAPRVHGSRFVSRRTDACGDACGALGARNVRVCVCVYLLVPAPVALEAASVRFALSLDILEDIVDSLAELRASDDAVL